MHSSLVLLIDWFGFYIIQEYETSIFCNMYYNWSLIYMVASFPGPAHRESLGTRLGIYGWTHKFHGINNKKILYMVIHCSTPKWYMSVYIWTQILDLGTMSFCFIYMHKLPWTCRVFMIAHSWLMRDTSIVHLNRRCFKHCLCHLQLGVLQQLKLLQGLVMVHRSQIVWVLLFT